MLIFLLSSDQTHPEIICPANITTASDTVNWPGGTPSATDTFDTAVDITCIPPSGSTFGAGLSSVICEATDDAGNQDTCTFYIFIGK